MIVYSLIGKGGVGKTLSASMLAALASKRGKTLVVSLDPAHNLGDTLGVELSNEPKEISHNLYAAEPDIELEISRFTQRISKELESHYRYLKVFNLDKVLKTIEFMPGVEEQVLFELFSRYADMDFQYLIVDHPPTGIALRVILFPIIMSLWVERLYELRREIVRRRTILANLGGEKSEKDSVLELLEGELKKLRKMEKMIKTRESHKIGLVVNPEELPVLEAKRTRETLRRFGIETEFVIVNKVAPEGSELRKHQSPWLETVERTFGDIKLHYVPLTLPPPKGIERISKIAEETIGELP